MHPRGLEWDRCIFKGQAGTRPHLAARHAQIDHEGAKVQQSTGSGESLPPHFLEVPRRSAKSRVGMIGDQRFPGCTAPLLTTPHYSSPVITTRHYFSLVTTCHLSLLVTTCGLTLTLSLSLLSLSCPLMHSSVGSL